ncbi:hypothetical protein [Bartonella raoultii]|nr:hypothetical protein [Bartonella raoultii]
MIFVITDFSFSLPIWKESSQTSLIVQIGWPYLSSAENNQFAC